MVMGLGRGAANFYRGIDDGNRERRVDEQHQQNMERGALAIETAGESLDQSRWANEHARGRQPVLDEQADARHGIAINADQRAASAERRAAEAHRYKVKGWKRQDQLDAAIFDHKAAVQQVLADKTSREAKLALMDAEKKLAAEVYRLAQVDGAAAARLSNDLDLNSITDMADVQFYTDKDGVKRVKAVNDAGETVRTKDGGQFDYEDGAFRSFLGIKDETPKGEWKSVTADDHAYLYNDATGAYKLVHEGGKGDGAISSDMRLLMNDGTKLLASYFGGAYDSKLEAFTIPPEKKDDALLVIGIYQQMQKKHPGETAGRVVNLALQEFKKRVPDKAALAEELLSKHEAENPRTLLANDPEVDDFAGQAETEGQARRQALSDEYIGAIDSGPAAAPAPAQPSQSAAPLTDQQAGLLKRAQDAIQRGAPRDAVLQRMRESMGFTDEQLRAAGMLN